MVKVVGFRLDPFLGGQCAQLLYWWIEDCSRAALKRKPQQPSTAARRQIQASGMVYRGCVAKGTRLIGDNGTAVAGPETEALM